jgi:hypothetical protein
MIIIRLRELQANPISKTKGVWKFACWDWIFRHRGSFPVKAVDMF